MGSDVQKTVFIHRCSSFTKFLRGSRRAENCGVSAFAFHGQGVLSPSLYNDRCQLSLPTLKVPQIQFLAGVCGHSVWQQRQVRTVCC